MEQIAETIKNFILNDVNAELAALEDQSVTLPPVEAKNIVFGTVDLSRGRLLSRFCRSSRSRMMAILTDFRTVRNLLSLSYFRRKNIRRWCRECAVIQRLSALPRQRIHL